MLKDKVLISVIIPCYNACQYIKSSISSLLSQTYTDWEAIYIDDGSSDDTLILLNRYVIYDSRIKVYSQKNQGAAKAREFGIQKAKGDYVTFLDVDDTLVQNALESFLDRIEVEEDMADIIVSGVNIIHNHKRIKTPKTNFDKLDKNSYLKNVLCGKYGWELCAKAYKRALFDSIRIPAGIRIGEDAAVFIQLVVKANSIMGCNQAVYNYIQWKQSASHIRDAKYVQENIEAACFIESFLQKQKIYDEIRNEIDAMFILFFSNSTRRGLLNKNHPLMKKVGEHITLSALLNIPCKKAIYILLAYYFFSLAPKLFNNFLYSKI